MALISAIRRSTRHQPLAEVLTECEPAKPRAGMRRRSNAAALRCAKGSLRCSVSWPVAKLASLTAFAALGQSRRVRSRSALARAATSPALLGAAYVAADAHPPTALLAPPCPSSSNTTPPLRGGRYPGWATCGAARSAAPGSARAARFVHLTRRDCPSATNEVSAASFAARPGASIAAESARSGDRHSRSPPRVPPAAPRTTHASTQGQLHPSPTAASAAWPRSRRRHARPFVRPCAIERRLRDRARRRPAMRSPSQRFMISPALWLSLTMPSGYSSTWQSCAGSHCRRKPAPMRGLACAIDGRGRHSCRHPVLAAPSHRSSPTGCRA